jgi:outer membrane protein TolC
MGIMRALLFFITWVGILIGGSQSGYPAVSKILTVQEVGQLAVKNSDLIQSQIKAVESDILRARGSGLLPNPSIAIQSGSLRSEGTQGFILETGVFQSLPFPGKLSSQRRIAEIQAHLTETESQEFSLAVQHEAELTAAHWVLMQELVKHSEERRKRFNLIREYIQTHPRVSPTQRVEFVLIENQIRLLEKGIFELEQDQKIIDAGVRFFLKIPREEQIQIRMDWISSPTVPSIHELEAALAENNLQIKKKDLEVNISETQLSRSKLDRLPDFNLGFSLRKEDVIPANYFYTGFLTVSIPIFDHGQYSIPSAQIKLESERSRREFLKLQLLRDLNDKQVRTETSAKILKSFPPQLVSQVEKQFADAESEFRRNRLNITVLLQLDAQVHETLDSVFHSQIVYLENLSQLLRMVGRDLDWK